MKNNHLVMWATESWVRSNRSNLFEPPALSAPVRDLPMSRRFRKGPFGRQLGAVAPGMVDIQQIPLYDQWTVAAATAIVPPVQFFTVPIGTIGSGFAIAKTVVNTNLTQPARLEAPRSYEIHAVRMFVDQNILFNDLRGLYNNFALALIVGEKAYQQGPPWMFPAGGGITGQPTLSGQTNWQNGTENPCAINLIAQPFLVKLEQGENFRVELQGTSGYTTALANLGGTGILITMVLDGILTRQVQ
jgi:hypothetical protein